MKELVVGQIVYKKVITDFTCACSLGCGVRGRAIATLLVKEGGFIADYDLGGSDLGNYASKGRVKSATVLRIFVDSRATTRRPRSSWPAPPWFVFPEGTMNAEIDSGFSGHDESFCYKVGETITVDNFDTANVACAAGIHCFETYNQALEYIV